MIRNGFFLILIFLVIPFTLISQNKSQNIQVTYDIYFNLGVTNKKAGVLVANGSSSFFTQGFKVDEEDNLSKDEFGNFYIDTQRNNLDIHISSDSLNTLIYLGDDLYKVKEDLPKIDWDLSNSEEKNINGFKALKATGVFRGREYIAWYTPEIPIQTGPWKFTGLPGLILEISDKNKQFQWFVKKINYPYDQKINSFVTAEDNIKEVSLKQYVGIFEEYLEERQRRQASRAPKGSKLISSKTTRGIELIYEWEEE